MSSFTEVGIMYCVAHHGISEAIRHNARPDVCDMWTAGEGSGADPTPCEFRPLGYQAPPPEPVVHPTGMCPHCGTITYLADGLTMNHAIREPNDQTVACPGGGQIPRCAESDARPLWNGQPNRRFKG